MEKAVYLRLDDRAARLEDDPLVKYVRQFNLRLQGLLLRRTARLVLRFGDRLDVFNELPVFVVEFKRPGDRVVFIEQERRHQGKLLADRLVVLAGGLGLRERNFPFECELSGPREPLTHADNLARRNVVRTDAQRSKRVRNHRVVERRCPWVLREGCTPGLPCRLHGWVSRKYGTY